MKKPILIVLLLLALFAAVLAQQPAQPSIKLPAKQSAQIKEVIQRRAELERQYRELSLVQENLLLDAALELGLSKERLKGLQLAQDEAGNIVLVPKPAEKK